MKRFLVYDNLGAQVCEITPNEVIQCERREVINGEHSLTITTTQQLAKNQRVLYQDGRSVWREYVIVGVDEEHTAGKTVYGTYYCVWSLQVDMQGLVVSRMPGVQTPVAASTALAAILEGQSRWTRGTVTQTTTGGASMYDMSAWQALGVLVETWQGELSVTIGVSDTGVISRAVNLYAQLGEDDAKRRYDFGADLQGITRTLDDSPLYCRISPRGKGEQTGDGYGRKITIESVNSGNDYLEYSPMVDVAKIPDGSGFIYPTLIVENSECETPAALKAWAQGVLEEYCTPKVTYEVDVSQVGEEGVDVSGVSLGDTVQVVDKYFGDGLRLSGRIVEMTTDELQSRDVSVKIGSLEDTLSYKFSELSTVRNTVMEMNGGTLSTYEYLTRLVDRLNAEINATGGYTYITQGYGLRTYDTAVSDPLVGGEASQVVEIKGGTIRIANSKTAQGEWEWKTVFTSGHIAADVVTAASIHTGFIGNAFANFWNLDTGWLNTVEGSIGGFTISGDSLYNGTASFSDDSHDGVYVGNAGITSVGTDEDTDDVYRISIGDGWILGFQNGTRAGFLSPTQSITVDDGNGNTSTAPALVLGGTAVIIDAEHLCIGLTGGDGGSLYEAYTGAPYVVGFGSFTENSDGSYTFRRATRTNTLKHGIVTGSNYAWTGNSVTVPSKTYVDEKVPSFTLSGNNLFITL